MFGIGFWELAVIILLGLVVLGPDRLVKSAKKMGQFLNNLNREFEGLK
jgi:Sec-independent protein translocase protein TatA